MTLLAIVLCIVCQMCLVGGQLFFKRAMNPARPQAAKTTALLLTLGVGTQAVWFFLWTNLLSHWSLSQIYPFEGLNPAMLAVLAWLVLKERLNLQAWIGLVMICIGIAIVSGELMGRAIQFGVTVVSAATGTSPV